MVFVIQTALELIVSIKLGTGFESKILINKTTMHYGHKTSSSRLLYGVELIYISASEMISMTSELMSLTLICVENIHILIYPALYKPFRNYIYIVCCTKCSSDVYC